MHLLMLNIPDLLVPFWHGTFDCDKTDHRSSWDWAVLQGTVWEADLQKAHDALVQFAHEFELLYY